MSSIDAPGSLRAIERRAILIQSALAIALCAILLTWIAGVWWRNQQPRIASISITDVQPVGDTHLCPGEPLRIRYVVHIAGAGVLDRDATAWKVQPPYTVIATMPQRIVIDGAVDQQVEEAWVIPSAYLNPRTGQTEPLPPGDYKRTISLSSRADEPVAAIGSANFSIRGDCP